MRRDRCLSAPAGAAEHSGGPQALWIRRAMLWNQSLEIGIAKIDDQHREIFWQMEILLDRSRSADSPEALAPLGDCLVRHFWDEQAMQALAQYPRAEEHKKLHQVFLVKYKEKKSQYEVGGDRPMLALSINKMLLDWLRDHIMIQDKDFARFYQNSQ